MFLAAILAAIADPPRVLYPLPVIASSAAASGRRFTHLPPDAVAAPQLLHYPFTLSRYRPLLLPNPS